jgi:hypothetical protein
MFMCNLDGTILSSQRRQFFFSLRGRIRENLYLQTNWPIDFRAQCSAHCHVILTHFLLLINPDLSAGVFLGDNFPSNILSKNKFLPTA